MYCCDAGIVPYINASIILQLLATVFPSLKKLQREEGTLVRKHHQAIRHCSSADMRDCGRQRSQMFDGRVVIHLALACAVMTVASAAEG